MTLLDLLRRHPRYLAFGFLHFFFSGAGQTFFISLFVAGMSAALLWGEGTFATIYSGVTLVAAFLLPLIGTQVDRLRVRYVSTAAAVVIIGGLLLLATQETLVLVILGLFMVRFGGQGILPLIGSTTIGRYFNEGRGKALALSIVGISVAEVIVPPLATAIILAAGYRTMWAYAAVAVSLVFLPLVWLLVRRGDAFQRADTTAEVLAATQEETAQVDSWTRGQVLRDRRFRLIVPIVLFLPFVATGLFFNQSVIGSMRGFRPELMALGISSYGAVRALFLLLGAGTLTDRLGPDRLLRFVLIPATVGLLLLLFFPASWSIPVCFGLIGMSGGLDAVLMPALWADRYGPRYLGSIKSTVRLLVVLSSAAAPVVFSYGLRLGVETWVAILLGYAALCFVLAIRERR